MPYGLDVAGILHVGTALAELRDEVTPRRGTPCRVPRVLEGGSEPLFSAGLGQHTAELLLQRGEDSIEGGGRCGGAGMLDDGE